MITYEVHGQGPVKAFALHGLFGGGQSFGPMLPGIDRDIWSLALPDLRGYALSREASGPYDLSTAAEDVLAGADELGWRKFALIGHSMGGKIALRVAGLAQSRVTCIVGLSPLWAAAVPFNADALSFFRSSVDSIEARQAIIALSTGHRLPTAWCRMMAEASAAGSRREAYAGYLESFVQDDFSGAVKTLDIESLLVSGGRDIEASRLQRDGWRKGMRRLETVMLEDCGHWAIHEAPLLTAALLQSFVARIEPAVNHLKSQTA